MLARRPRGGAQPRARSSAPTRAAEVLTELGKKLAERSVTLLVLPGALFVGVALVASIDGHAHALDVSRVVGRIESHAKGPLSRDGVALVLLLLAVLLAAVVAGLAAQGLGSVLERLWLAEDWPSWIRPLRTLASRRTDDRREHRLDLGTVWPAVWLTLPETVRTEVTAAREALTRAATLSG